MNNTIRVAISQPVISARIGQLCITAKTSSGITLTQSYPELQTLPQIGGITLVGDKSAAELSLLSSRAEDYERAPLYLVKDTHYVLALGETNVRVPLSSLAGTKITTVNEVPSDMETGDYIFLKKGE